MPSMKLWRLIDQTITTVTQRKMIEASSMADPEIGISLTNRRIVTRSLANGSASKIIAAIACAQKRIRAERER